MFKVSYSLPLDFKLPFLILSLMPPLTATMPFVLLFSVTLTSNELFGVLLLQKTQTKANVVTFWT